MKLLVTGGAGFIGSNFVRYLLDQTGDEVVCVDNFNDYYEVATKERNVADFLDHPNFKLYRDDIEDYEAMERIFKEEEIEKVCHLAARTGVRESLKHPQLYEKTNVLGTLNLLEFSRLYEIQNFVFASSSSVYGDSAKTPFKEDQRLWKPLSMYGATKQTCELMAYTYHHLYGLPCTAFRFFTVYGPFGRPDMAPYKFTQLIHEGKPIPRYGDGSSQRDYTYVEDMLPAIHTALEKNFPYEIINLGNDHPIKLNYFIEVIEKLLNKKAVINEKPKPSTDPMITHADITKAKELLNYEPKTSIEEGMGKFIKWYLAQC